MRAHHLAFGFGDPAVEKRTRGTTTRFAIQSSTVWLAALLVFCSAAAWGQGLGEFVGAVTDPSGAGIPNAKITVAETGTGFTRNAATSTDGLFTVAALRPSVYSVTVEAPGFRNFVQKDITLLADQRATVNVKLELGTASESVSVVAEGVQVDTTTQTIKQVVDQARIVELPLNGRNAADLTLLVPGAVKSPSAGADQGQQKTYPGATTISANGARVYQMSFLLDGGNNVDEYTNVNAPFPFPDALQEFSVQTSNYSAEYGQNAGGVVNIITRSGTNEIHGAAFGFVRNAVFNARNFFAPARDPLKRSQFGGTFGGPVMIPHLYNGRDKTFIFLGYQGTRLRNVPLSSSSAFVPTPANLQGDYSALLDAANPANPLRRATTVLDPLTGQPFAGNRIPVSRYDPASLAVMKLIPTGAVDGSIFFAKPVRQGFDEGVAKFDHAFSEKDRLTARYFGTKFDNRGVFDPTNLLTYGDGSNIFSQNALLHETHIFSPSLLNDFRLNYARENAVRGPVTGVPNARDFGVNIYQPPIKAIEGITITGFFTTGDSPPARFTRNNWTLADDVRWIKGRHNISFGFHGERSRVDLDNQFLSGATFGFTSDITNYAIASFLMGKMRTFRQGAGEYKNNRATILGLYIQDSFRANSKLTLNYGLRYEPAEVWNEIRGRTEQFRPDAYARGERSKMFPNAPPGLFFPGDAGVPERGLNGAYKNFAPRAGFAYDVFGNGKTSIRGGTGMFFDTRMSGIYNNRFVDVTPFSPQITYTDPTGPFSNPYGSQKSPFPSVYPPPKDIDFPAPVLAVTYEPTGTYKVPVIYNWNLAIEHQARGGWLARVAYVGSHASHVSECIELNPARYIPGSTLSTDQRRIFQGFQYISLGSFAGNSGYNSFQGSIEKRLNRGFTVLANYTFAKSLDNMPFANNSGGPSDGTSYAYPWYFQNSAGLDRGPSDADIRHRFVASYVWELPGLKNANPYLRVLAGGWQWSGLFQTQSGSPLTMMAGRDQSQTGLRDRAVITGSPYGPGACGNAAPCVDYINPRSFALPAVGEFGTMGKGALRFPGQTSWDMGFFKNFPIHERLRVQFRAEFFNLFNRVNYKAPDQANQTNTVAQGGFGSIRAANDPRIGQLALKIVF